MSIRPLSAALRKKAEEELHETPTAITEGIQTLRDWLKEQPHLHSVQPTDQWLVAFLRGAKYDMEKAKEKIYTYYKLKTTLPEFFGNRDPLDPGNQELLKLGVLLPLKKCTSDDSPRIVISRAGPISASGRPVTDIFKVSLMVAEVLILEDDNFTVAGEDALLDIAGCSFSLVWQFTPSVASRLYSCIHNSLTIRLKSIHILYAPFYFGPALALFKMFLSAKLKKRIHSYKDNLEPMHEYLDKSVLPQEYGGTDGTVDELIEYWKAKVESYRDWFIDENAYLDDSKGPTNKSTIA